MTDEIPLNRRNAVALGLGALVALRPTAVRAAPDWPDHPLRLIVPFAPGGGSDVIARTVAAKLSARLGQPIVVENKSGAGGNLGADFVAKAPPDGYTMLFTTTAIVTNATSSRKLPYDVLRDFSPIGTIGSTPLVVVVAADSKFRSLSDLLEAARARPNTVNYGSGGISSMSHLGMELVAASGRAKLLHVPYKGMGPAYADLLAGNVQAAISTFASAAPLIKGGKLRGLAVTGAQRSPFAPELPTVAEAGLPGAQIDFWWGLMGPARVPAAIVARVSRELDAWLAQPDAREVLAQEAATPMPGTPEQFSRLVTAELGRWSKLVKDADIQVE